jgi:hypothetical protein
MRRAPGPGNRLPITTEPQHRTLRVDLELAEGQEPIQGQLRDARGTQAPFTGWLELIESRVAGDPAGSRRGDRRRCWPLPASRQCPGQGPGAHAVSETAWKIAERLRGPLGLITYPVRGGDGDATAGYHGRLLRFFRSIRSRADSFRGNSR